MKSEMAVCDSYIFNLRVLKRCNSRKVRNLWVTKCELYGIIIMHKHEKGRCFYGISNAGTQQALRNL